MHWIRRSVGCRVASASPRLATRHSSPGVTAARFIASVNLRRLTSRRVSGYLPTYLPIHLSVHRAAPACRRAPQLTPFVFRFISSRASYARDARSITAEIASRYSLRCNGAFSLSHLLSPRFFANLKFLPLKSQRFLAWFYSLPFIRKNL